MSFTTQKTLAVFITLVISLDVALFALDLSQQTLERSQGEDRRNHETQPILFDALPSWSVRHSDYAGCI